MDSRMLITYIIVDIFCIIIVGVIKQNITTDSGSELEVKMLRRSLWSYIVFMIAGLTGLITENNDLFYFRSVDYIANIISLTCLDLSAFYWFIYVQLCVNKQFMRKKQRVLTYIPMFIVVILCVSSPFTGWAFYINNENDYMRGPMFMFVSVIPLIYDVASTVTAYYHGFHEKRSIKRRRYFNYGSFIYFPLIASILQIWLSGMPILAPAVAAAYYIVFTSGQKDMIYNDSLTGLNNRRRAMIYLEEKMSETSPDNPFTAFMIDGNKFKVINDTYGHIEGDSAIVCIGQAVEQVAYKHRIFCARFGGDEFLMLKAGKCQFDRESIGNEINERLKQICAEQNKPYILSVSVGLYTSTDNRETSDAVIKMADAKLYEAKARR